MADPNWKDEKFNHLDKGLAVARMAAHITYLSKKGSPRKIWDENFKIKEVLKFSFEADFQIESYLRYQGVSIRRQI